MNDIKDTVEQAIEPLKKEIAELRAQLQPLLTLIPKPQEVPAQVKEAREILNTIPKETLAALNVIGCGFDPGKIWFQLICKDGRRISVKRTELAFRIRLRGQGGELLKELSPSFNGLANALKSLA
jgi:hypothetical protein